jgi:glycosyltransferase involved in cell wall biosynthesis
MNCSPDFSIITASKASVGTISLTIDSIAKQRGISVQHIVKDAFSDDGTIDLVKAANARVDLFVSHDRGIYDGMNQGFSHAKGRYIGFLNSDDFYPTPDILRWVRDAFDDDVGIVYGDISIVGGRGEEIRRYVTGAVHNRLRGRQIPHPAIFVRRELLAALGLPFDPSYRISADFKQQLILVDKMKVKCRYIPQVLAVMRVGGESTRNITSFWRGWNECARAYREVHGCSGWPYVALKVAMKLPQIRFRRKPA